jgi:hypothetical protein
MIGKNGNMAKVLLVQKNPGDPTVIEGNTSGGGGNNAFYLNQFSQLTFRVEEGKIELWDAIAGDENKDSNNVILDRGDGWLILKRGGAIRGVNFENRGNLSLVGAEETEVSLKNFVNSGRIKFEIFKDGRGDKITAENIILGQGTVLEIAAHRGTYRKGTSYNIMTSTNVITDNTNNSIELIFSPKNLIGHGELYDEGKIYRITIDKETIVLNDPEDISVIHILGATEDEQRAIYAISRTYVDDPTDELVKTLSAMEENLSEDRKKSVIAKISHPRLIPNAMSSSMLLASTTDYRSWPEEGSRELMVRPIYRNMNLGNGEIRANVFGLSIGHRQTRGKITFSFESSLENNSLRGDQGDRASIVTLAIDARGKVVILKGGLNIVFDFKYLISDYSLDRSIEEIDKTLNSKFFSNTYSLYIEMGKELKKYNLTLNPYLGLRAAMLTHGDFEEKKEIFNVRVDGAKHHMVLTSLGVRTKIELGKLNPFLVLESKWPLSSDEMTITSSLQGSPEDKFETSGPKFKKPILSLALGTDCKLGNKFQLSLEGGFQYSAPHKILDFSFNLSWRI